MFILMYNEIFILVNDHYHCVMNFAYLLHFGVHWRFLILFFYNAKVMPLDGTNLMLGLQIK